MTTTPGQDGSLTITPVTRAVLLDVYQIEQCCFPQPWPYPSFEQHLEAAGFLVAKVSGRVVGYVVGDLVGGSPDPAGHIKDLAVHPQYRRKGIARRLLSRSLVVLEREGAVRVELEARESNDSAQSLYREFGFEPTERRPAYYDDDEDAIVMVCSFT